MGNAPSTDAEKSASQSEGGVNIDLMDKWSLPEMPAMPIFGQDSTGLDRGDSQDAARPAASTKSASARRTKADGPAERGVHFAEAPASPAGSAAARPNTDDGPGKRRIHFTQASALPAGSARPAYWAAPQPAAARPADTEGPARRGNHFAEAESDETRAADAKTSGFSGESWGQDVLEDAGQYARHLASLTATAGPVPASQEQLKLLQDVMEENKRLKALRAHYTQRLASPFATIEEFELLKQQRTQTMPSLQKTSDSVLCEAQINKTVAINLDRFDAPSAASLSADSTRKLKKEKKSDTTSQNRVERVTVRKCWSTGAKGSSTSSIRVLGTAKYMTVDTCSNTTLLIDQVLHSVDVTACQNLELVIGGHLPYLTLTQCSNVTIFGCARPGYNHELSMSCCEGIVTALQTEVVYDTAVRVIDEGDQACVIHLPDALEASVQGNTIICELENSGAVPDECLPMTGSTMMELTRIDRRAEIADISLSAHEEHEIDKHVAKKMISKPRVGRVQTIGRNSSFKWNTSFKASMSKIKV